MADGKNNYIVPEFTHFPHVIPGATPTQAGVLVGDDKVKLNNLNLPNFLTLTGDTQINLNNGATSFQITQSMHLLHLTANVTIQTIDVSKMPAGWSGACFFIVDTAGGLFTLQTGNTGNIASVNTNLTSAGPALLLGLYDANQTKWYLAAPFNV